ncbi:hypothetical protein SAMN05192534_12363 [Alteribacillus persepolensis]|uniref:Phage gp6-like head-tail connector protein n=1 Tax=Alteribacillus persepolensis TaxID=568899 RepID=A0A1G8IAF1_9BACI|nr:hypothetical protein [Alteribacillus persepolensis]SDI15866.1 hypothetical protein SAMN05192534_12363 [Alteribacillus persepolensis]
MAFRDDVLTLAGVEDSPAVQLEIDAALDWANEKCKTEYTESDAPAGFKKAIAVLVQSSEQSPNVTSESVAGELSVSYSEDSTATAKQYLRPYMKARFL